METVLRVGSLACLGALSLLLAAGCAGGSQPPRHGDASSLRPALARRWEAAAQAVASAAAAGDGCRAKRLAGSLRDDVIASQSKIPGRLRSPLLSAVNTLANRISCMPPEQTVTIPVTTGPPKHGHGPPKHGHGPGHGPGHGGHGGHGGGGDK